MQLHEQLDKASSDRLEPIAVVGMGCRFPGGVDDPESYWELLSTGKEAFTDIPADRWDVDRYYDPDPKAAAKMACRRGGFLDRVDLFDADFFGVSPREAASMDPQIRFLLEVAWQAIEDAGVSPSSLRGSSTGVFVAPGSGDYFQILLEGQPRTLDAYFASGTGPSMASGRISYHLGLQGPSISVDTACSSSLVAVYLACQSLRAGDCNLALAGGCSLIMTPQVMIALSQAGMLAPDGQCRAFDEAASGMVRGEGCGLVALKRLSDAERDGDHIRGLLLGMASNQDGRSSGITAPNGPSQGAVIRAALERSGLEPHDIGYVEAHGTGTTLGDPIEVRALGSVFGPGRPQDKPFRIGSVKTNIGHLEFAAGIAGLMKVVLSLEHEAIPPHPNLVKRNPHIDWSEFPIDIPTELTPWPVGDVCRRAGVSSFGFSGSNAHIILQEAPPVSLPESGVDRPLHIMSLSARSEDALRGLAQRYERNLDVNRSRSVADTCFVANAGRAQFNHRLAIVGDSTEQLLRGLADFRAGKSNFSVRQGRVQRAEPPEVAFLFTGQGSQFPNMGRELFETQPAFRATIERCDEILRPHLERPLLSVLYGEAGSDPDGALLNQTAYTQPALFSLEYALCELWRAWGIEPAVVLGHSLGEYVAACVAGVFSLEEGLGLVARRARLMQDLPAGGGMAVVFGPEEVVRQAISACGDSVTLAALNGPENTVISGVGSEVAKALKRLEADGVSAHPLQVSHAFHSELMEPMLDEFEAAVAEITLSKPRLELISNLTGSAVDAGAITTPQYWRRHAREPVRFADSIKTVSETGLRIFLEIGPAPILLGMSRAALPATDAVWLPSLAAQQGNWSSLLNGLAELYVQGAAVNWAGFDKDYSRQRCPLPTYPFQRERFWVPVTQAAPGTSPTAPAGRATGHPLLGQKLESPGITGSVFEAQLIPDDVPFVRGHQILGEAALPASAYLDMAVAGAAFDAGVSHADDEAVFEVEELVLHEPIILSDAARRPIQLVMQETGKAQSGFEIVSPAAVPEHTVSRVNGATEAEPTAWRRFATGKVRVSRAVSGKRQAPALSFDQLRANCLEEIDATVLYGQLEQLGVKTAEASYRLCDVCRRDGEAIATIHQPEVEAGSDGTFRIHPSLLDLCFHAAGAAMPEARRGDHFLLASVDRFELLAQSRRAHWAAARLESAAESDTEIVVEAGLFDPEGQIVAHISGAKLRRSEHLTVDRDREEDIQDRFYAVRWDRVAQTAERPSMTPEAPKPEVVAERLRPALKQLGRDQGLAMYDDAFPELDALSAEYVIQAFRSLGWNPEPGDKFDLLELADRLGVIEPHKRLFRRLLEMLAEDGLIKKDSDAWQVLGDIPSPAPARQLPVLEKRFPDCRGELSLAARCGERLADVIRGSQDPLDLLFPKGQVAATEALYQDAPFARTFNRVVRRVVREIAEPWSKGPTLRVLEIGAGTGGTTSSVLPEFEPSQTDYLFTDVSPLFLEKAQEKFAAYPFMRYDVLDIEADPAGQGYTGQEFDLILAANVLHATRDLSTSLRHARQLLAPGGCIVLLEGAARQRWVDLTFGLTDGWWRFTDTDIRADYPLISGASWIELLAANGLEAVDVVAEPAFGGRIDGQQAVIMARLPGAVSAARDIDAAPPQSRPWIIHSDSGGLANALAAEMADRGEETALVAPFASRKQAENGLKRAQGDAGGLAGIVHLGALNTTFGDDSGPEQWAEMAAELSSDVLQLVRALDSETRNSATNGAAPERAKLWLVTRGAQAVEAKAEPLEVYQATLWGLGRVIALEYPEIWGGMVDLDPAADATESAAQLARELSVADLEDQVAYRGGQRFVARLARSGAPSEAATLNLRADCSYLITGGLGGLGLATARRLATRGARHITLLSRQEFPERSTWEEFADDVSRRRQIEGIRAIEALGAEVIISRGDIGDPEGMAVLFAQLEEQGTPVRGVIHAAVDMSTASVGELNARLLASMFHAKIAGLQNLHRLTMGAELDFLVLFSTTTSLLGVQELAHYAAANQFLDAFAHWRRSRRLPAISVNWGTWEEMRLASEADRQSFQEAGIHPIPSDEALDALEWLVSADEVQSGVASIDWSVLKSVYETRRARPFLSEVDSKSPDSRTPGGAGEPWMFAELSQASPEDRGPLLLEYLQSVVGDILAIDRTRTIDPHRGLFDTGMDSLMAVELRGRLETSLGCKLPSTLIFNYPNLTVLTDFLLGEALGEEADVKPADTSADVAAEVAEELQQSNRDAMSEDELADMLRKRLEQIQ